MSCTLQAIIITDDKRGLSEQQSETWLLNGQLFNKYSIQSVVLVPNIHQLQGKPT